MALQLRCFTRSNLEARDFRLTLGDLSPFWLIMLATPECQNQGGIARSQSMDDALLASRGCLLVLVVAVSFEVCNHSSLILQFVGSVF